MDIVRIKYSQTKNLGNYENEKIELEAEVDEDENVDEVIKALRAKVEANFYTPKEQRLR